MAQALKGFPYATRKEDLNDPSYERIDEKFVSVLPAGPNKAYLGTYAMGLYRVGAADRVAEVGSSESQLVLTGHDILKGDTLRFTSTANPLDDVEIGVRAIIDANTIEFEGVLSAAISAADTFDILRPIAQRFDDTGASLASVVSPPIQFIRDAATVTVTEDTVTPANNIPLPVKLTDITGDINITAGDLNVQLDHTGASFDSVRIGDGTNLMAISAAGEISTLPNGSVAHNAADSGNPIKVGGVYNSAAPTLDDGDRSDLQTDVNGRLLVADITVGGAAGVYNEDSAHTDADPGYHMLAVRQDTLASSVSTDGDYGSLKINNVGSLYVKDGDVETAINTHSAKFTSFDLDTGAGDEQVTGMNLRRSENGGSVELLGQGTMAQSIPVAIASDQSALESVGNIADNAADAGNPIKIGGVYNSVLPTYDDGDRANLQTDVNGRLLVSGQASSAEYAEDSAASDGQVGISNLSVRQDTLAISTDADGDYQHVKSNNLGQIYVKEPNIPDLGQQTSANSMSVTFASDAETPASAGRSFVDRARLDYSSTNVTTGAWVELKASILGDWNQIEIFDSSGQTLELGFGAAASEVSNIFIVPGGNGKVDLSGVATTRVAVRAISATADVGELTVNFLS